MLIHSLSASNFRKYESLELTDLPQQGVITVSGLNESGKSSIGEVICFALFERTFNLDGENLQKLIRWDTKSASVELILTDNEQQQYIIERHIDQHGKLRAKLSKQVKEDVIAAGSEDVNRKLVELLGYDYATFADSFYLAAQDLSNPTPDSNSIKQMAGIGEYARISDELEQDNTEHQQVIDELTPEITQSSKALDDLNLDETWLPELVDAREVVETESAQKQAFNGQLAEFSSLYNHQQKQHQTTRNYWRFFNLLSWIIVPLMLVAWGVWILYNFFPQQVDTLEQSPTVSQYLPTVSQWVSEWGFVGTMGLVLFASFILLLKWLNEHKAEYQQDQAYQLSQTLDQAQQHSQRSLDTLMTARLRTSLQGKVQPQSALTSPPQDDQQRLDKLAEQCKNFTADGNEIANTTQRLRDTLDQQQRDLIKLHEPLQLQIIEEKRRSDEAGVIRSGLMELRQAVNTHQQHIDTQTIGIDLLKRASDALIADFNTSVTERSQTTMPRFTGNRYKQIRINKDLLVHVYSDEKMDWIDFDELSSGTQRQILLAVRIAMSEQLALNTDNLTQFIFLDEPFTYFDQDRTKASLEALPKLSEVVSQVWIVAQEFPKGSHSDKAINCPATGQHSLTA
ncbi:ATP-binding protein [Leucothrix mucor]|uniref:ATP-binding protein n=1 Tax=Leucothrix mucor TaxID=45248 RepID=UPI0003B4F901|nr:AAA family ATPase [Leucothrix mucor]